MPLKLGILAGGGILPRRLIEAATGAGREVFVIAFMGQTDPAILHDVPHVWSRLGAAGEILSTLKRAGVRELVMAGHIRRPSLTELRPDWRAARIFAKVGVSALGDDGLLQAVRRELETEGFHLVAPQDVVSGLIMPVGQLGLYAPRDESETDINRGIDVLRALSAVDVGQAVVVQQGLVLGIEAIEGTAALIARCKDLRREGAGGVLVKLSKAQQDEKLDLPTIGPDTVLQAHKAGLSGIAVEANRALLLDRSRTVEMADEFGLFLVGIDLAS